MGFDVVTDPRLKPNITTLRRSTFPPITPREICRTHFMSATASFLRSQTSATQIRTMENRKPPIRMICPAEFTVRTMLTPLILPSSTKLRDLSSTRALQCATLKAHLNNSRRKYTVPTPRSKFRPSFFPFTEPSVEVDVSLLGMRRKGLPRLQGFGWIEILGAAWFTESARALRNRPRRNIRALPFGIGLDRLTTTRYKISDIRLLFENDVRFLSQLTTNRRF